MFHSGQGIFRKKRKKMNKNRFLFLILTSILTVPAFSQWHVGASGGHAYNHYDYDPQYMTGLDYKGHHSFSVDLPLNYQFNDWFALSTGLSFQQKGFVMNGSYIPEGSEEPFFFYSNFRRNDSYIVVPMMAEFSLGNEKWESLLDIGGYAGWWMCSIYSFKRVFSLYDYFSGSAFREFDKAVDQRLEVGAICGLGIRYNLSKKISFDLISRAFIALTPQQKDYQIMHFPSRNTTITTQIGFLYHFN